MPDSLPRPDVQYHVQFAIEGVGAGDIPRTKSRIKQLDVTSIEWDDFEDYEDETADGVDFYCGTLPVLDDSDAQDIRDRIRKCVKSHCTCTVTVREVQDSGTPEVGAEIGLKD